MFYTIEELVQQADNFSGNVAELMITTEIELTGRSREEILTIMSRNLTVMKDSIVDGLTESKSVSGLTGGDAAKLDAYMKSGKTLSDSAVLSAARNAMAVNELNAKMGLVCATPTAGSAGCLPAVLGVAIEKLNLTEEQQLDFLFTAGAFGLVIANNASISCRRRVSCRSRICLCYVCRSINSCSRWNSLPSQPSHLLCHQKYAGSDLRSRRWSGRSPLCQT